MSTAIKITNLSKSYKDVKAVSGLNLEIEQGKLFALLGVNGAGKTTTIKMLCTLLKPDEGNATLLGESIVTSPEKVKELINVSPQETAVAPNLTVVENLELIAGIYGIENAAAKKKTEELIAKLSLSKVEAKRAKTLSGGYQRRLSIAMALITEPKILFLDEPTLGLDVIARRELWGVIEKLKGEHTIILTTHYMEEAEALADAIGIMVGGKLIFTGTSEEIKNKANTQDFEQAFITIAQEGGLQ